MTINLVVQSGILLSDPEVRPSQTQGRDPWCTFALGIYAGPKKPRDRYSCICFGKASEIATQNLHKGDYVTVSARLRRQNWTGKDGSVHNDVEFVVTDIDIPPSKGAAASERTAAPAPQKRNESWEGAAEVF